MKKPLAIALCALSLLSAAPAFAEPTADDRAVARSLFDQARVFMKNNDYTGAAPKLEESMRLDPGVGTLFNLADCYEHLGRVASAWGAFAEAADLARRAGQKEREDVARARANALEPKLSRIHMHLASPRPEGLEIHLDNKLLGPATLDTDLPIDPGDHRVHLNAPGKTAADIDVKISTTPDTTKVELPALADAPVAPVAPPPVVVMPPVEPPAPQTPSSDWHRPAAIALGAGAVVGLAIGAGFALKASGNWSDAKDAGCPNACSNTGYDKWDSARGGATVSTVGFVVGGALAAAAVIMLVTRPHDGEKAARAPGVWRF